LDGMNEEPNLEEVREWLEKLKERIGIRDDHALLLLAIWWGLLELDDSPPKRLSKKYIKKLMERAEVRNKMTIESVAKKGLKGLAKYYGMLP